MIMNIPIVFINLLVLFLNFKVIKTAKEVDESIAEKLVKV